MARLNPSLDQKLTDSIISILGSKKIYTVFDLVSEDSVKIMQFTGLTYQEILELKQKITNSYAGSIRKGSELLETYFNNVIGTEIASLDHLLRGGLRGGEIYEICGIPSSGKSQLCHTVAINIANKFNGIVHYIETKGDFAAKRIHAIIKSKKLNEDDQSLVLDKIILTRVESSLELMNFLHNIINNLKIKSERPIKLLIIDSLPAIFFNYDLGKDHFVQIYALNHLSNALKCISNEYNIPLITINLTTEWREDTGGIKNSFKYPLVRKPMLGERWRSVPNTRLFIETTESENRKISVWKSTFLPTDSSCSVTITNAGVV